MKKHIHTALFLIALPGIFIPGKATEPDTAFNNQFRQEIGGWIAADATYSIHLPDGRTLWLFGDTFIGEVNPDNSIKDGSDFIRNSGVIQDGEQLETLYSGTRNNPSAFIPTPHPDSTWYWPEHGVVENDSLRVFVAKFRHDDTGTPGFNFAHAGNDIAVFTYPGLEFIYSTPINAHGHNGVLYGNRILADTSYTYIYGRKSDPEHNIPYPHIARASNGNVHNQEWEYYDGNSWSADPATSQRINDFQVSQQYSVSTYRGKYILLTQDIWLSPDIYSFTSVSPTGPWSGQRKLFTTPETLGDTWTYNAYAHPQFNRDGELLVSYNVNGDFFSIFNNVEIYRPRFIRIPYMNMDFAFWPNRLNPGSAVTRGTIKAYPNPVESRVTIEYPSTGAAPARLEIINTHGTMVKSTPLPGEYNTALQPDGSTQAGTARITLDLEGLPPGIYVCRVVTGNRVQTIPILKK